ncbi:Dolichyl-phosphate-mannose-protein mannosyltransferase [Tritrichomonas foetus]|uniref:Dolichyl-phosphate-mannose-protein mannosyltransferase n=1 Tax=Tritrichomonas foetus TaxID=1144522 RepID=A0A1J4JF40_9EUKA|nr:Dolichyl-phosphate-mannose-protein mannosyltransferase [Tritrichomonas foetus]|eukprot:OHS96069.1 Dolichyl-phosphate-mannose-protein mannosyltransferase [Tritrichomonas foetus]
MAGNFFTIMNEKKEEESEVTLDTIDFFLLFFILIVSFIIRYWRISLPSSVVFDEVYFGNFSNFYIKSQFYYDIHPPLAKILMFVIANLSEYDGSINFNNCPKGYPIPDYVQLRITPATFSALCFPLIYVAMRFSKFGYLSSFCAAVMALCDTSLATEGRQILTDGILHFFTCLHVAVLSYTLNLTKRRSKFYVYHILTGLTLGAACSCKNTAWGLTVLDAFAYIVKFTDIWNIGVLDYLFDVGVFGGTLAFLGIFVYCLSFYIHFILLPYAGPGYGYLRPDMKAQLIPNKHGGASLNAVVLKKPSLLERTFILTFRMHRGNMGIRGFHDSRSFPKHWPVLGSVSVYFWGRGECQIRCWGNAIVYYLILFGLVACVFSIYWRPKWLIALRFVVGYCVSYFPFFWIPRTLYLYHYLIPLIFGCMSFGAATEMLISARYRGIFVVFILSACAFGYWLWSPYVYGTKPHDKEMMIWTQRWIDGDEAHKLARIEHRKNKK